jgi:hypothetical protein
MARRLKPEEYALIRHMLEHSGNSPLVNELDIAQVNDMNDGGMGSLRFAAANPTKLGKVLCEAESKDSDNVPLDIAINLDEEGNLFELDIWKVDFSPLQTYPAPSTLSFSKP